MRILLTNDDGIHADGIRCLAARLAQHAQVLVVAPDSPNSATSHCITLHKPLRLERVTRFGVDCGATGNIEAYACSGTPSDCVMLGALHVWRETPPDIVISGINDGVNVAQDLTYSGTVGGALEGAVCGRPSLAVSLAGTERSSFASAAAVVELLLSYLVYGARFAWNDEVLHHLLSNNTRDCLSIWDLDSLPLQTGALYPPPPQWIPPGLNGTPCLNVNLPDVALPELQGIAWTVAGYREYRDVVTETLDPRGKPFFWIAGEKVTDDDAPGTDTRGLAQGFVTVTPITYDITARGDLVRMDTWLRERNAKS